MIKKFILVLFFIIFICCSNTNKNKYETIKIGDQVWMKENLKVESYRDGRPINFPFKDENIGVYYTWDNINDGDVCPEGFKVPSKDDFSILLKNFGEFNQFGYSEKGGDELSIDGSNKSGFSALLSGWVQPNKNELHYLEHSYFWSSTPASDLSGSVSQYKAYRFKIKNTKDYSTGGRSIGAEKINSKSISNKKNGFNVRCIEIEN